MSALSDIEARIFTPARIRLCGCVILGANIVKRKSVPATSSEAIEEYARTFDHLFPYVCFFTINIESGRKGAVRPPPGVLTQDPEQARASMLKLAALEPAAAWPGHGDPLLVDVRAPLEHAAAPS